MKLPPPLLLSLLACLLGPPAWSAPRPRARDLGIPFEGRPGRWNAITDVPGVEVGQTTLISGEGRLVPGQGPIRTGVTAILPLGRRSDTPVPAGWFSLNGYGEMTGTAWVDDSGTLEGPILLTNTHSVGTVRDAVVAWGNRHFPAGDHFGLPVVAETWDGFLNDINGFHVKPAHVFAALDGARSGPVAEGNRGGGTGMVCFEFKCGTGTASRLLDGGLTLGVLVQANFGARADLHVAGVPVGRALSAPALTGAPKKTDGSIIIVLATDAPLLPHQLRRVARHAALGLARTGGVARSSSGDLFIAFSTAAPRALPGGLEAWRAIPNQRLDPLFVAAVQATEEAIVNALVAAEELSGVDGHRAPAIPREGLLQLLRRHLRLSGG